MPVVGGKALEQLLPALFPALLHQPLDLLRASASGDHQGIGHVDDNDIVHAQQSNQTPRPGDDDPAGDLFGNNCRFEKVRLFADPHLNNEAYQGCCLPKCEVG
jgi:hypothetical protein